MAAFRTHRTTRPLIAAAGVALVAGALAERVSAKTVSVRADNGSVRLGPVAVPDRVETSSHVVMAPQRQRQSQCAKRELTDPCVRHYLVGE